MPRAGRRPPCSYFTFVFQERAEPLQNRVSTASPGTMASRNQKVCNWRASCPTPWPDPGKRWVLYGPSFLALMIFADVSALEEANVVITTYETVVSEYNHEIRTGIEITRSRATTDLAPCTNAQDKSALFKLSWWRIILGRLRTFDHLHHWTSRPGRRSP